MSALSDWIKERRHTLNLTQTQVANKLGLHQVQVSALENGKLKPDIEMMQKIDIVFGKFAGSYVPVQSILGAEKEHKEVQQTTNDQENNFFLRLDNSTFITADRNQYILRQHGNTSYFTDIKALLKYLVASQIRQSAIHSIQDIIKKLDDIYNNIEKKFDNYDPANVKERTQLDFNEED